MSSVDSRELFAPLGPTYDRVGAALSFGQDPRWRRYLVSRLPTDQGHVLDVATGTGLVALELVAIDLDRHADAVDGRVSDEGHRREDRHVAGDRRGPPADGVDGW